MKPLEFQFICNPLKSLVLLVAIIATPYFGTAQTYQKDTATIHHLLESAQSKKLSDTTTALKEAHQALVLAQKHNDAQCIFDAYLIMGNTNIEHEKVKNAQDFYILALNEGDRLNDKSKVRIHSELANTYAYMGNTIKCFEHLEKSYTISQSSKDIDALRESCANLSQFYCLVNEHEKATQFATKSLEYATKLNDFEGIAGGYRLLTRAYIKSKNYDLAYKNIEKCMSYIDKVDPDKFPHHILYLTYGTTLRECGHYEKSLKALKKCVEFCQKTHNKSREVVSFIEIADTYTEMNDLKNAELYYLQAAQNLNTIADIDVLRYQGGYGNLMLKKGNYDKAITLLEQSNALATKLERKSIASKNYKILSEAYEKKGNDHLSLLNLKKSNALQDSVFKEENTKRVADAQFKYNLTQSEEQVKALQQRQTYAIVCEIIVALVSLIAFLMYFSRSKYEKNKILIEKNQEIKSKNRQLEESNEILRQFAYASAHDLKEPLRGINSFINIIQKKYTKNLPPEANEYMSFVTLGVKRMESLLNALLEFSSVLTDENVAHKKNDVTVVLKDVFQRYEDLMIDKKALIRYPSVFPQILMNEAHLKQILYNLVHNALKFSKNEAKIEIGFNTTSDELILFVKDQGIGLDKSYSDKIFKLFQRLDRVTHEGSVGIGLTICKNIVDKYAGRLWFESVVNEGTTFYIAFPKSMISDMPTAKEAPQYFEHLANVAADLSAKSIA
jgi:signal transduction histidine kinase